MNGLPAGWVWTTLEDVVGILDSQRIPINATERDVLTRGKQQEDLVPYYGATGQVGWIDRPIFHEELVLLGEDGAPFLDAAKDKAYQIRGKSWVNNHAHVLRARQSLTSNGWICHYLNSFDFHEYVTGTTRLKLNQGRMKQIPVPLAPLPEQHRIVAEIETHFTRLDAGVAALKRVQANLRRYKASVLKAACEGRLVPTEAELARAEGRPYEPADALLQRILAERRAKWEAENPGKKYQEPAAPDTDELPELPEGWVWAKFDQLLVELKNGYFGGRPESEPPGVPILRVSAVRPMSVSFDDPRYLLDVDETKQTAYLIREGNLFFTRYNGSRNLVGACGMVRHAPIRALYPDKLIRALVPKDLVLPGYLEAYFNTEAARDYIESQAKTTAGQYGIAGSELRQATVALPPLAEQHRIVADVERRLSVVQEVEATVAANLKRAERLRQSILKRAFEGRLVPQDAGASDTAML